MPSDDRLLDLVGTIYDCALDPAGWPDALQRIGRLIEAGQSVLIVQDPVRRSSQLLTSWNVDPSMAVDYAARFVAIDPTVSIGWYKDIDEPYSVIDEIGEETYTGSLLYREWVAKYGFHDNMQTVLSKSLHRYSGLSFMRRKEDGCYSPDQIDIVRCLAPHVRRSTIISDLVEAQSSSETMLAATLDLLTTAVIIVDPQGRIEHANLAAGRLLDQRNGIRRDGDNLAAADPRTAAELKTAIARAAQDGGAIATGTGTVVPISTSTEMEMAAWVLPLDRGLRRRLDVPIGRAAAVFIRQVGVAGPLPGELFVKRFGISPAECRVLMMLTQGMAPKAVADCLGVSLATTKTHLARLFQKTGTGTQADLMRLAMSALAPATN